jgi:hypothetical protein
MSRIPEPILDALESKRCLFFIGSGVSTEAGLPSAGELVTILAKKLESSGNKTSSIELQKVADEFVRIFSRPELLRMIREEFVGRLEKVDRTSFELMADLPMLPKDIITTNWDPLIEEALRRPNYTPIFEPEAVARYDEGGKINLFKIHGDIDREIVISERDYQDYKEKWKPIVIKTLSMFQEKVIVFIGYSTDDDDFLDMYMEVFKTLGQTHLLPRYCVDPKMDTLKEAKLRERGIQPIILSAKEFLLELGKQIQERLPTYPLPSPKTVPTPPMDFNPFGIFRAEDIENISWINQTFVQPIDFVTIKSPGNVVIEGHRGSGKSMILQYLSYPSSSERKENTNYVGFYVKLQNSYFETLQRREMDIEEWKEFFLHYFSLILGEAILITVRDLVEANKISFSNEKEFAERVMYIFFPELVTGKKVDNLRDLWDVFERERNKCARYPRPKDIRLSSHFIYDFVRLIEEYVPTFKGKYFYLLIDEYDKLYDDQQRVVNLFMADRGAPLRYRISFKIAVKLFEMCYETIDGRFLDHVDDYEWVPLDRFSKEKEREFIEGLKKIGNTRLHFYQYKNASMDEILPPGGRGFERGDYSGLENVLILSSFLVRDFLELTKDMLYYDFPWITSERRSVIPPVPPYIQNLVINVHSNILYRTKIDEIPGKVEGKERNYLARILIEKMGIAFQRVLRGSRSLERRTISSFQLSDEIDLSKIAKAALDDCRSIGALQVPFTTRAPQNYARHAPHRKYEFHRLLCPRFRLSLLRRWPKEISAMQFNRIFESPDKAIDELTFYFLSNIFKDDTVESLSQKEEGIKIINIYRGILREEHHGQTLFGQVGEAEIQPDVTGGFMLKMGNTSISCKTMDEAKYLRVFSEMGLNSVGVPNDPDQVKKLTPIVEEMRKKVEDFVRQKLEEYPILRRTEKSILGEIWSRLLKNE